MKYSKSRKEIENKIFTIVNPASAGGKTGRKWPIYRENFYNKGIKMDVIITQKPGEATELAKKALYAGYKNIMTVGGDGTVNEVVNGFFVQGQLINPGVRLIIFSRGSGSDYIKTLGISAKIKDVINIINNGSKNYIDIGLANYINHEGNEEKRYFVNIADTGIGGETVYRLEKKSKKLGGFISYLLAAVRTIGSYQNKEYSLTVDGRKILNRKINSVIVANGKYFAGGMQIAPGADLRDGNFNIIILGDLKKGETILNLYKAYRGQHLSHAKVEAVSGREVILESEEKVLLEIDGESVGRLPAGFTILEKKLPVLIIS